MAKSSTKKPKQKFLAGMEQPRNKKVDAAAEARETLAEDVLTRTTRKCPCCKGAGRVEISSLFEKTLQLLRKHGASTGAGLARIEGCKATAMNNRLARLEDFGLAISRRDGREVFYTEASG